MEHEESDESCKAEDKERNVQVDQIPVKKESSGILKENSLKFDFIWVEEKHAYTKDCQDEADDCNNYLPAWIVTIEASLHHLYAELATRIITPRAIKQTAAAMGAIFGTNLGMMWTTAIHNSPSPNAVTITIQKALRKP